MKYWGFISLRLFFAIILTYTVHAQRLVQEIKSGKHGECVRFSQNGNLFGSSHDGKISIYNSKSRAKFKEVITDQTIINDFVFADDGKNLLCVGETNPKFLRPKKDSNFCILKYNIETGALLYKIIAHSKPITCLQLSKKEQVLTTGSQDKTVKIWDLSNKKMLKNISVPFEVFCLSMHPSEEKIAIGGKGKKCFELYDYGKSVSMDFMAKPYITTDYIRTLSFNSIGDQLVLGGDDKTLFMFDFTRKKIFNFFRNKRIRSKKMLRGKIQLRWKLYFYRRILQLLLNYFSQNQ